MAVDINKVDVKNMKKFEDDESEEFVLEVVEDQEQIMECEM